MIRRITFRLPLGIDHVHCYALAGEDGEWTLVDAGLDLPGVRERWQEELAALGGPVARLAITHFHPDHIGASGTLAELTGAEVVQGRDDHAQALAVWRGRPRGRVADYLHAHGMPEAEAEVVQREADGVSRVVRLAPEVTVIDAGDRVDGWEAVHLPGHADGHISLFREDVMVAGDALLGDITPNVGLWPESRPDPLADYLDSLREIVRRAPRIAYPGHGAPIENPAGRARAILDHHDERLERTAAALREGPRNAYDVSLDLFPDALSPGLRRFALVESLAHLEYLARQGAAVREGARYGVNAR